jgi:D-3-phosphoglycerate dehydrogenase
LRIALIGQFDGDLIARLAESNDVACIEQGEPELAMIADAEILVTRGHFRATAEVLTSLPKLRLLVKAGTGTDNIDLAAAERLGVMVETTPVASTSVAELAIGLLLAVNRRICFVQQRLRAGDWGVKYSAPGRELRGSTLGILGFGRIGQELGRVASGFEMTVLVHDQSPEKRMKQILANKIGATFTDLSTLLLKSDAVSLHLPLDDKTRRIIGWRQLALMQRHAVLINTGRAATVDREALLTALLEQRIAGAGLDVFHDEPLPADDPLLQLPQVVCTPHIGAQTIEAMQQIGRYVCETVHRFVESHRRSPRPSSAHTKT